MKIFITGTTGESMPPPYAGVPKLALLTAKEWKKAGHEVGVSFVYRPSNADDLGANADYFFEYSSKPTKLSKVLFLLKYFFSNPSLYLKLFADYFSIFPHITSETILYPAYGVYLDQILASYCPDVILCEAALVQTYMAANVAKRRGISVVIDSYAEIHDESMGANVYLKGESKVRYWKNFLSFADLIIPPGPYCCRGPLCYAPEEKVKFVYDGSDYHLNSLDIKEDKMTLRQKLGLPTETFLIGNVGAFETRKGHDDLIKAIGKLRKRGLDVGAVICGGSGDPTKWKELARAEGAEEGMYFFGRISELDLARMYKTLDAFSDLETTARACGFTMSILEGMAMGLPVVVYDNQELFAIVKEGINGFSVPIRDVDKLADAIARMNNVPEEKRREMGQLAAKEALQYDINYTAEHKFALLTELLAKRA